MTKRALITTPLNLTLLALMLIVQFAGAKEIPAQLPDPDRKPPAINKPVKVYVLSGQSNMVGIGQISGGTSRWGKQFLKPVVSIYPGKYSPTADYDQMTALETKALPAFGGVHPTPFPSGGTAVVRGFIKMETTGIYKFNAGYSNSSYSIMEVDGVEVYRKEVGKEAVHTEFKFTAGKKYPFKITFLTKAANGLGWVWRTDIPGTLNTVVKTDKKFPHLVDEKGNWTVRNDVWYKGVVTATANKWLTVGCGAGASSIGPELQFGHIMGYYHDEPVIIIKASQGNRSLGWDYLPPGSERFTYEGRTYAGYKDTPSSWVEGEEKKAVNWYAGKQYDDCFKAVHEVLDNFGTHFPQYKDQGYEIAGFVWWQGHKDGNAAHASRYEFNLVNLIKSLRKEFNAPKAPFVIATIGFGGWKMADHHLTVANAQLAVSDPEKYPEFAGNVLTVETRDFWKEPEESPRNQGFHYNGNAETYMMVGDVLGRGMVKLLSQSDAKTSVVKQSVSTGTTESEDDGTIFQPGAKFCFYPGKWSPELDIDKLKPVYKRVILRTNPPVNLKDDPKVPKGDYFVVCRGYLRVLKPFPARKITPGYRDSTFNVMTIDGREVHRKNPGDKESTYNEIYLSAGYHPYEIVWFKNKNYFLTMYGEPSSGREVWHKVPFEERMQTELFGSFNALKMHIEKLVVLNVHQMDVHKEKIKEHRYIFGHNRTIVKAGLDLVETFENVKGALWRDFREMNKGQAEPKGINWTIYHVMQYIIDEVYTAENLAKYEDLLDGYKFQCSDYFPGKVDPPANPDKTHTVKVSATQKKAIRDNRMYVQWPAVKPTGAYLAPGSIATVTVPEVIVNKSYRVRVGAHYWDNTYKPRVTRLGRCTTVFPIDRTEVKVANPLGGGIYIEVPYLADAADVIDVTVQNAVRSPYFSAKPFHRTTLEEWRNVERNFKAPWADFQSEKFMMNVPTSWIYKLDDPVTLMKQCDKAMAGMNYLLGLPEIEGKETMYVQIDLQLRATVFAPGYPSVNSAYSPKRDYGGNHDHHFLRDPRNVPAVEFHERCHAYNIMHLLGESEATVHLPHVAVLNRVFGVDIDKAFQTSCTSYSNLESRTIDNQAISWMVGIYFSQKQPITGVKYKHIGHVHWVDIARLFGWEALHKFYYSYNVDADNGVPYGDNVDKVVRLCESAGVDLRPLLHFWGRFHFWDGGNRVSGKAVKLQALIYEKKLPASAKIYDQLVRYKSMVPKDNKEFREFTTKWWGKKPRIEGFCHESGHARQWDSQVLAEPTVWPNGDIYDENSCARVKTCVQEIIDIYFPNGRPKGRGSSGL